MQELESLKFTNKFAELPEDFFHKQSWTPFDNPRLVHFNKDLAEILGFPKDLDPQNLVPYVNGNKSFKQSAPLSMAYAGHQFGLGFLNLVMAEVFCWGNCKLKMA